jgi:hypothetical protein
MEYLTDSQMKREKPIKSAQSRNLDALGKFLSQNPNLIMAGKKQVSGRRMSVFYAPRRNQVVVID